MDILPTKVSSFRTPKYWNQFYSNPKLKEFEWYIDISQILGTFYKCIMERDVGVVSKDELLESVVVNVGCGNSNLSDVLLEEGFKIIYNLDFSQQVLDEMRVKVGDRAYFVNVDVSKTEYEDFGKMVNEKYADKRKIIVDKAFMDAFISIDENESKELIKTRARQYLESTFKMMSAEDVFIMISVSQDYVIAELVRNVLMKSMYVDIYPVSPGPERRAHMIHFIYAIYKYDEKRKVDRKQCKLKDMPNMPCEQFEIGQLLKKIKMAKTTLYLGPTIRKHTPKRRLAFDIFPNNKTDTCFTVVIYDSEQKSTKIKNACIIVPAAQEHLWLYSTPEGNQELAMTANCSRLLLIWLKYTKDYSNLLKISPLDSYDDGSVMEYIKGNLAEALDSFSVENSPGITIMKVGESARIKGWICELPSKYAGKVIVRDVYHEELDENGRKKNGNVQLYARQMIFSSNPQVIQSELLYYEKGSKPVFMFRNPTNEYHVAIALSTALIKSAERVLILGGGTGVLTNVLLEVLKNSLVVVELDEAVWKVAIEYFGYEFEESKNLDEIDELDEEYSGVAKEVNVDVERSQCEEKDKSRTHMKVKNYTGDALEFIRKSRGRYAAIILDINNSSAQESVDRGSELSQESLSPGFLMSPNPDFLDPEVLERMDQLLENGGILVLNVLTRSRETRKAVLNKLSERFKFIALVKTPNDINEVLICSSVTIVNAEEMLRSHARELKSKKIIRETDSWVNRFTILKV